MSVNERIEAKLALVADGLMSVAEVAGFLKLSRAKVYELMECGDLAFVKIGRARRIPRRVLVDFTVTHLRGGWKVGRNE